jgi:hypothetical protein
MTQKLSFKNLLSTIDAKSTVDEMLHFATLPLDYGILKMNVNFSQREIIVLRI